MKMKDLRGCDRCGGSILPVFHIVEVTQAIVNAKAVNRELGMIQMMGGSMGLARVMGVDEDVVTKVPHSTTLFLCQDCSLGDEISLSELIEKRNEACKDTTG